MNRKKRTLIGLIFVAIFTTSYSIGAESKISDEEAKAFVKEFQHVVEGIDTIGIFTHNSSVALPMFIPGFGVAWGTFAAWSTGVAFNALITTNPILAKLPPLAILLVSPFGVMELAAYSIGMSRSFLLIISIIKKTSIKEQLRPTVIEIGIVIALLLVAAFIEWEMLNQFGSNIVHPKP